MDFLRNNRLALEVGEMIRSVVLRSRVARCGPEGPLVRVGDNPLLVFRSQRPNRLIFRNRR